MGSCVPEPWVAPEYVRARRALLDALELLVAQLDALVLVGAQAVYLHAPASIAQQETYTTDSDLAVDPDLLAEVPDVGQVLLDAGYTLRDNPGTFYNRDGIPLDIMVPSGALPPSSRRTAQLPGQNRSTARRTVGLELALIDTVPVQLTALKPSDPRSVTIRVAGPAALIIAKLIKLEERMGGLRSDRVLTKDAADVLRLLRYTDAIAIGTRLRALAADSTAAPVTQAALTFLKKQLQLRRSPLVELAVTAASPSEPQRRCSKPSSPSRNAFSTPSTGIEQTPSVSRVELYRCAFWPAPRRCSSCISDCGRSDCCRSTPIDRSRTGMPSAWARTRARWPGRSRGYHRTLVERTNSLVLGRSTPDNFTFAQGSTASQMLGN